ncbi:GGDEF domain-containing protein [Catenovulum maritimum]|uniref:diguanylate cyclase n=1 Tax=Catenovulum maritimum TaxID=1513271 RepID=A0A0J8JKY4_9ALTE|nr:GGDEF domain-containing protein [Catenovulum maritimum]KMT65201.1 hypothetical protein XM47_10740 [Catenovulum maritimum]
MKLKIKDTAEQIKKYSEKAQELLASWALSMSPINYAVAYEIAKNVNIELRAAYLDFKENDKPIDDYCLEQWQVQFLQSKSASESSLIPDIDKIVVDLQRQIKTSDGSVELFMQQLTKGMSDLVYQDDIKHSLNVIQSLLNASNTVKIQQTELRKKLEQSQQETKALQTKIENMEIQAITDPLTGLLNRRGLEDYLKQFSDKSSLAAIVVDVDHFKRINDSFGHLIGDIVITKVAEQINKVKPDYAKAVRYGGEEFVILLPEQDKEALLSVAEKIREQISAMKLVSAKNKLKLPKITASFGVAQYLEGEDFTDILSRADDALYVAKNLGRNQVQYAQ